MLFYKLYDQNKKSIYEGSMEYSKFTIMKCLKLAKKDGIFLCDIDMRFTIDNLNKDHRLNIKGILVLEDDEITQESYKMYINRMNHYVKVVPDADSGTEQLLANPDLYDFILTDQLMPSKTGNIKGDEFAKIALGINPEIKVYIVTGDLNSVNKEALTYSNVLGSMAKPINVWTFYLLGKGKGESGDKEEQLEKKAA